MPIDEVNVFHNLRSGKNVLSYERIDRSKTHPSPETVTAQQIDNGFSETNLKTYGCECEGRKLYLNSF